MNIFARKAIYSRATCQRQKKLPKSSTDKLAAIKLDKDLPVLYSPELDG